ncbi:MAG: glycosyltransferase family 39 protein [Spirochaetales bacterium]|nr:glycosyltransferase family 39 protein [Spirochaetales bacterium]
MIKQNDSTQKITICILLILVTLVSAAAHLFMRFQTAWPNGLDGFFYAMEAKSFIQRGHLENPSFGPMYYISGVAGFLAGDVFAGVKLAAAVCTSLLMPGMYFFCRQFFSRQLSLLGALLTALSPSLFTMSINYLNNIFGLVCFLFFSFFLLQFRRKKNWQYLIPAMVFSAGAILGHLSTGLYALAFGGVLVYDSYLKKKNKNVWLAAILVGVMVCIAGGLLVTQWERFRGVFACIPSFPVFSQTFWFQLPAGVVIEMTLLMAISFAAVIVWFAIEKRFSFFPLLAFVFYFPFWDLTRLDMGYRLLLSATPAGIFAVVFLIHKMKIERLVRNRLAVFGLCFCTPLIFLSMQVYTPQTDPPYEYYHDTVKGIELPDDSLLIAHLGLNHVYTYYNNFQDALNYLPDFPVVKEKLWRLAYGVSFSLLDKQFPEAVETGCIKKINADYLLIREDYWRQYLESEDPMTRKSLENWFNPSYKRPGFIRMIHR